MRKEKLVTRTITFITANVMALNPTTKEVKTVFVSFVKPIQEKLIDEMAKAQATTNGYIGVMVESLQEQEKLFGMPESVFLANAVELPPRIATESAE